MKTRIFYKNPAGRDLFFIDIYDIPDMESMWVRFSMGREAVLTIDTERIIRCIEERLVNDKLRSFFVSELFKHIQAIPNIEQVYLQDSVLKADGTFSEELYNTLEDLYKDFNTEDYEPLTMVTGYPFEEICGLLFLLSGKKGVTKLNEKQFSEIANNSDRLASVFNQLKRSDSSYFSRKETHASEEIEIFWMNSEERTVLAFVVRTQV